ncbi:MAG: T9SS type A sorting domain-containing protein [Bacteroidota bacterium]
MSKNYYQIIFLLLFMAFGATAQYPASFASRGVGGGGALFSPSINPANEDEYFVSCDMSELFHSSDYGLNYDVVDFRKLQGGHNTKMVFTSNANIRYTIDYTGDLAFPVKSTDGGQTWNSLPGNPDVYEETFSIFADYNNPGRVIISYYGTIYLSNDGGNSFADIHDALNNGAGVIVGGVFFDGQNIYIGTNDGLLVSSNGGNTFVTDASSGIQAGQQIFSFAGARQGNVTRFFVLAADVNDMYVGVMGWDYWGFIRGVYSMDYGSNLWTNKLPGIITAQDYLMYVAMADNDTGTAYLAGATYLGEPNVMRWRSSTNQWQHVFQTTANQNIYTGWSGSGGDHGWSFPECFFGIAVAPFNSDKVIVTDFSCVHKTADGGVTWQQAYLSAGDQHPAGASTPVHQLYHSSGIENTTCWQVFWRDQTHMLSAFSDITAVRSDDAGVSWSFNYSGINANTVYRFAKNISNSTLYAATSTIHDMYQSTRLQDAILDAANATGKVLFSADNGTSWQTLHDFTHPVYWIATDPNNVNRMYASVVNHVANLGGIWVSNDINLGASSTWTRITPPGRTEGHPGNIKVLNDGTVLCTFNARRNPAGAFTQSSGVFIYNPGLQTWSDKSDSHLFYWTQDVVVDPNDPAQNTWYAGSFNGWGGPPNGLGGLYKTTDRGNTWARLNAIEGVTSVTFNPNNADQVFVATETDGLLTSTDINSAAPTFQTVLSYPFRQPQRIFFNPYASSEMWVSSFGNGMKVGDMTPTGIIFSKTGVDDLKIYPNPAKNKFTISNGHPDSYREAIRTIEIFNPIGEKLMTINFSPASNYKQSAEVDISALAKGVYLVNAVNEDGIFRSKLIIE